MKKYKSWLTAALALQLIIAMLMFWGGKGDDAASTRQPLLASSTAQANRIVINDGDNTVTLQKFDEKWQLPELSKLPANSGKLDSLLSKLEDIQLSWPVATTSSSQQRFEVAEDKFQRRLQLFDADQLLADVYVGTSPGFRKVHARRAQDNDIFAITLNSYELSAKQTDWLDKSLLSASDIQHIAGTDYALERRDDLWVFSESSEQPSSALPQLDTEQAKQLISALEALRVQDVVTQKPEASATSLLVKTENNEWTYQFISTNDNYYVSRNDIDMLFSISKTDFETITDTRRDQLALKDTDTPSDSEQTDSSS